MTPENQSISLDQSIEMEIAELHKRLKQAQEKAGELDKARIAKAQAEFEAEKARRAKEAFEQHERIRLRQEAILREREEAKQKAELARRQQQEQEERLAREADQLRIKEQERLARQKVAHDLAQAAELQEAENRRVQADLFRKPQPAPAQASPADSKGFFPGNDSLAFDPVITGKDAANHDTMGREKLMGRTTQGQTLPTIPVSIEPVEEYRLPDEFRVCNGRLDNRVFAKLFGPDHPFPLFISPQDGNVVVSGYRWRVDGILSRNFHHNCPCVIEQLPSGEYVLGYTAQHAGNRERVPLTLIEVEPLARFENLTPAELRLDTAVDADEDILGESSQGITHSRSVIHG